MKNNQEELKRIEVEQMVHEGQLLQQQKKVEQEQAKLEQEVQAEARWRSRRRSL